ncbi:MAG: PTS sugar transporter subunit IIB [Erysipelotrichaceae bacterium]|nr:PTS sugar transporter subunit IIB [Erysipelotrichaceae bacterium]
MLNIVLVCNGGMSTSILANRIVDVGEGEVACSAYSEQEYGSHVAGADIVMVGPQVRYLIDQIKEKVGPDVPVVGINPLAYGRLNAAKILEQAKSELNK